MSKKEKVSLAEANPTLAAQWHPYKNFPLSPEDVAPNSHRKVWWFLPYYDPETGHHCFVWSAKIDNRNKGRGCPFLTGQAVWRGYNDLATRDKALASEWNKTKNGMLTPCDVTVNSTKKVWWQCERGHEWQATIHNRHTGKQGCPHCSKELGSSFPEQVVYYYMKRMFDDAVNGDRDAIGQELDIYIPSIKVAVEYDGYAWHKDLEKDKKKNEKCKNSGIRLIRIRESRCPEMRDDSCLVFNVIANNTKTLTSAIVQLAKTLRRDVDVDICRDLAAIQSNIDYVNKQNSLSVLFPDIAKEWHPKKNGNLTPESITAYSGKIVWWRLRYYNETTNEYLNLDWPAAVCDRTIRGDGCPYLSGHKVFCGLNDLLTLNKTLANEWNYEKNLGLKNKKGEDISTPDKVTVSSNQKVWWKCSKCAYEWQAPVNRRNGQKGGCPQCAREKLKQPRKRKTIDQSELEPFNYNEKSA